MCPNGRRKEKKEEKGRLLLELQALHNDSFKIGTGLMVSIISPWLLSFGAKNVYNEKKRVTALPAIKMGTRKRSKKGKNEKIEQRAFGATGACL
jgi:hypothetical protein